MRDVEIRIGQILRAHPQLDRVLDRAGVDRCHVVRIAAQVFHEVHKHPDVVDLAALVLGQDRGAIVLGACGVDGIGAALLVDPLLRRCTPLGRTRRRRGMFSGSGELGDYRQHRRRSTSTLLYSTLFYSYLILGCD